MVLLLLLVWRWQGESPWPLAFLRFTPAALYLLPVLLLALWGCSSRRRGWRLPLGLAALVVALGVGAPAWSGPRSGQASLRVLTLNLGQSRHLGPTAAADLVFLQEVPPGRKPAAALREQAPGYQAAQSRRSKELMLLSRYPIFAERDVRLGPGLWAHQVDLDVGGRRLRTLNVSYAKAYQPEDPDLGRYLREMAEVRAEQTRALLAAVSAWPGPLLVAGDFNSPPNSATSEALRGSLEDAFVEAGRGFGLTFPSACLLWRLDYVYHDAHFRAVRCEVMDPHEFSDHRGVLAELEWLPSAAEP